MGSNETALLLFTRTAVSEVGHKDMLGRGASQKQKLVLAQSLISKTRELCHHTGLDVIVCTDFYQKGETFGKRLSNAFEETFYKGYHSVIAIGSDTPSLTVSHITSAVHVLQNQNVVLGPSTDGGVYLIGMQRHAFCRSSFESLPWLSASVYTAFLKEAARQDLSVQSLEKLADIDDARGLLMAIGELSAVDGFHQLVLQLLYGKSPSSTTHHFLPLLYNGQPFGMRAPPFC